VSIGADREDLDSLLLLLSQQTFQLPELFYAEGSPVAAVENQNHGFLTAEI
jgi:aromatic ring-opening dioxygenase catalytic subunit (LigB family)